MTRVLDGVRYLFHVAADYRLWARDPNEIARNNLAGARAVMGAAKTTGVERIVYLLPQLRHLSLVMARQWTKPRATQRKV